MVDYNRSKYSSLLYLLLAVLVCSCANEYQLVRSDIHYKPLPQVQDGHYKSPQERVKQDPNNAIGISVSGGGSRAQYFGLGVLIELDEIQTDSSTMLKEIDYYSTVSGGGFGVGYYMSLRYNGVLDRYNTLYDFWLSDERIGTLQSYVHRAANGLSTLKQKRYEKNRIREPYPILVDYELLQVNKVDIAGNTMKRIFIDDFFIPEKSNQEVTMPMFVTNGTIFNNTERLPFMPHIIDHIGISGSLDFKDKNKIDFTIIDGYGLPLTYGVTGSAAFPGALPMVKLSVVDHEDSIIRIFDGGAVDNLGITTLFELMDLDTLTKPNKGVIVIDCADIGSRERLQPYTKVGLGQLTMKALLFSVDTKALYADQDIRMMSKYYDIDTNRVKVIGTKTLREEYWKRTKNPGDSDEIEQRRSDITKNGKDFHEIFYSYLTKDIKYLIGDYPAKIKAEKDPGEKSRLWCEAIRNIDREQFDDFSTLLIFDLFELISRVESKVKIRETEKEVLVLAGRYATYLERNFVKSIAN